jgi:hypothetical protein
MEVNDKEMLNVCKITKNSPVRHPVVQFDAEAATVNCYITLFHTDEMIRRPSVIPVEIDWLVKPSDCIYMTLILVNFQTCELVNLQTFNHHVIMYLNSSGAVRTSILSNVTSDVRKIRCMLDKLSDARLVNNVQCDLGLKNGILVNERVIDLYYKMCDYLSTKRLYK